MVKFGGHVEAIREGDLIDSNLYLIPYNEMKSLIYEINSNNTNKNSGGASIVFPPAVGGMTNGTGNGNGNGHAATTPAEEETKNNSDDNEAKTYDESDEDFFIRIWKEALVDAEEDFRKARADIWQTIFEGIRTASNNDNN